MQSYIEMRKREKAVGGCLSNGPFTKKKFSMNDARPYSNAIGVNSTHAIDEKKIN